MKKSTGSFTKPDIFLDTSGFFAVLTKEDAKHAAANAVLARAARDAIRLVTTDYVLAESATLLLARGKGHLANGFFERVLTSGSCQLEWMDPIRFDETQRFFLKHLDQKWSFTDCFSFRIMRALGLRNALSTDEHFRHAGFNPLLA